MRSRAKASRLGVRSAGTSGSRISMQEPLLRWNQIGNAAASGKSRVFAVFQTRKPYNLRAAKPRPTHIHRKGLR
jgi:hypothetical protein